MDNMPFSIEFVSYTGKYPAYCSGVLTLRIDGKDIRFGHDFSDPDWTKDGNHISFWYHGRHVDEWIINPEQLPEEYRGCAEEIDRIFNENVKHSCCGGCPACCRDRCGGTAA